MRLKNSFFKTYKEDIKDEDCLSSNLLVRSGMIKKSSSGVYIILPLGYRVLSKIQKVIEEEMDKIDCGRLLMPSLIHEDIYKVSKRTEVFGNNVFSLKDKYDKKYILGPTHEELFALVSVNKVNSYKDLPFSMYQFQTKYRDETRPRYGLIRTREFIMKDAYTFDIDESGLDVSYLKMYNAYKNILDRLNVDYRIARADTGVMGGLLSEEFQAITNIGEDTLAICDSCSYASNIEIADTVLTTVKEAVCDYEEVETLGVRTIEEVKKFFNEDNNFVKTIVYNINSKLVAVAINSDYEINLTKLGKLYDTENIVLASNEELESIGLVSGYVGVAGINCELLVDKSVLCFDKFVTGANKEGFHYKNMTLSKASEHKLVDVLVVNLNDVCPICKKGHLTFNKGIEVGNTFKLGTKYSEYFNLYYVNSDQKKLPVVMGSYGIGIQRLMASIVEQSNDEKGIIWPSVIAPYEVCIVVVNVNDQLQITKANELYTLYKNKGIDVVMDDRDEKFGVKMNDMELIGIPKVIVIGRSINDNEVEIKLRDSSDKQVVNYDEL